MALNWGFYNHIWQINLFQECLVISTTFWICNWCSHSFLPWKLSHLLWFSCRVENFLYNTINLTAPSSICQSPFPGIEPGASYSLFFRRSPVSEFPSLLGLSFISSQWYHHYSRWLLLIPFLGDHKLVSCLPLAPYCSGDTLATIKLFTMVRSSFCPLYHWGIHYWYGYLCWVAAAYSIGLYTHPYAARMISQLTLTNTMVDVLDHCCIPF